MGVCVLQDSQSEERGALVATHHTLTGTLADPHTMVLKVSSDPVRWMLWMMGCLQRGKSAKGIKRVEQRGGGLRGERIQRPKNED